jgi:predicted RNA-binding Zn ribbon-like protein
MSSSIIPVDVDLVGMFVNTLDLESGEDDLATPVDLHAWFRQRDLLPDDAKVTQRGLVNAIAVREALRALIGVNNGMPLDPAAYELLTRTAERAGLAARFALDGSSSTQPTRPGLDGALGQILAAAHRAMALGIWRQLRLCGRDSCRWAFYDASKNQSKRWCSMETCGNRAKGEAFRHRHATRSGEADPSLK